VEGLREGLIGLIVRRGVDPLILSPLGLLINLGAALAFSLGRLSVGGALVLAGGAFDLLDGPVARAAGKASDFGAFYDSCVDRCSDGAPLMGLLALYAQREATTLVILVGLALLGTLLIPYARARAEALIERCDVGIMERAERFLLLGMGGVFHIVPLVLWVMTPLMYWTVGQRIHYTWHTLRHVPPEAQKVGETKVFHLRHWRTRR
jgi:CDP-diacylglycerol--glycerol-3-phosphate 3-phosphatidyltransferase